MNNSTKQIESSGSNESNFPRAWMAKVDAATYHSIRTNQSSQFRTHRCDQDARKGDLIICVGSHYSRQDDGAMWRLGALYAMTSDPKWHPVDGYIADLRLISLPEYSIPFEINMSKEGDVPTEAIIALDLDSLDFIREAIQEYSSHDSGLKTILNEISRARTVA